MERRHFAPERGAISAEYAVLAALIALGIVVAVQALGGNLSALLSDPDLADALTP